MKHNRRDRSLCSLHIRRGNRAGGRLADWLVAMEATGVYWIPVYDILEARGLEVLLVNARHVKNVPGRKSDVEDCEWLRELHSVGLLRGSFRPAGPSLFSRPQWSKRV